MTISRVRTAVLAALIVCAVSWDLAEAQVTWDSNISLALQGGTGGPDSPQSGIPLYVCRAPFNGGLHPGTLYNGQCHIGDRMREISNAPAFQVAHEVTPGAGHWGAPAPGNNYAGALVGGSSPELGMVYVCRSHFLKRHSGTPIGPFAQLQNWDYGTRPGELLVNKCFITYGGREIPITPFEVFYPNTPAPPALGIKTGKGRP